MGKIFVAFSFVVSCIFLANVGKIHAEGETASGIQQQEPAVADWKQELITDRQEIKEQRDQIKENAQEARSEEKQLRDQIHAAIQSGDMETARRLKEQLKATHQENVQQMIQDKKDIRADMQEYKGDVREAKQEGYLPPKRDWDNNPPGPKGGPGTNWENPPGPKGGPGAGPDKKPWKDRDNNPPGPKGGPGTNWENKPGPQGGPGASPDRKPKIDRDNNPPGPKGGHGTNWENKPGPKGGPGASPNRKPAMSQGGPKGGRGGQRK